MAVESKKILRKLKGADGDRGKTTLYLNRKLFAEFKEECGDISASKVIDELMKEFLDSAKDPKKK